MNREYDPNRWSNFGSNVGGLANLGSEHELRDTSDPVRKGLNAVKGYLEDKELDADIEIDDDVLVVAYDDMDTELVVGAECSMPVVEPSMTYKLSKVHVSSGYPEELGNIEEEDVGGDVDAAEKVADVVEKYLGILQERKKNIDEMEDELSEREVDIFKGKDIGGELEYDELDG